jgi:carbon-monoxide dehydrogenase medium subunit
MKPAPFRYVAARSVEQALALKAEHGDEARFLAGGQSLVPAMNFRLTQPAVLIDINPIKELAGIRNGGDRLRIGALTRYRSLERDPMTQVKLPLIAEALPVIAHPQIRNRGTIGGNLSHADPASELPALAVAMEARMRLKSSAGERQVAASAFFQGALITDIQSDEMLVEIELPRTNPATGTCFMETARRRGDFAITGVAAMVTRDEAQRCARVRLALCGVGEVPVDASGATAPLIGQLFTDDAAEAVAANVQQMIEPPGNVHATSDYQRHLAGVLTQRALGIAYKRAGHGN